MVLRSEWTPGRVAWAAVGGLAIALGAVGVVLPVLPTTPFVLLAAFAFAKSSPRLARLLEENRVFGPVIADWRKSGAIAPRAKALALVMMAFVLVLSLALSASLLVLAVQAGAMAAATAFILTRPNRAD